MPGIQTQTLAEVYARQGLFAEACDIYEALVEASPEDAGLLERLEELRGQRDSQQARDDRHGRLQRLKVLQKRVRARRMKS